jgi:outer membrane lipoprotein SlyB
MTHLEAGQGQLITEAKAAAGIAATGLAGSVISEVVTRVTRIEMRQDDIQRRLPPPPT